MTISMMEHANGMLLPKCNICGRDIFCRDVSSMQALHLQENSGFKIMPHGLDCDLVGHGLRQDDFTCSTCLRQSNLKQIP